MAKYGKKLVERIADLVKSDTYTIAEICKMVGIDEATYYRWKKDKNEFCDAIKKAEDARMEFFVVEAKKSLLKKIQGYTVQEKSTTYTRDKEGKPQVKEQKNIDKHYQPDTAAIIFTLTNGDSENWKNRQNTDLTNKGDKFETGSPFMAAIMNASKKKKEK
ncbi:phBC6A51 family helix-turn-helix protein [Sphingobacterium yanglingense]|uniref:Putative insertion element HTH domain-containing protein n=1 Tax=Sphingobacterium yanglingense TaxID=1437280 RepID=A0A4R6WHB0_9SPHI|nr:phBC6A51 family helix-turn-helix protein [Sphingobacterium yanglingense]TDQ79563.1 putative insertion element HTH domain-containing protein [Sphingobacterium yanglingense]